MQSWFLKEKVGGCWESPHLAQGRQPARTRRVLPIAGAETVVEQDDFSNRDTANLSCRRGPCRAAAPTVQDGSARDSHPGTPNGSPLRPPAKASAPTTARAGLGPRLRFPSRCCAASAGLSCPRTAPQQVHTCFTRFLASTGRQVRRRRRERRCRQDRPAGGGCARNSRANDGPAPGPLPGGR